MKKNYLLAFVLIAFCMNTMAQKSIIYVGKESPLGINDKAIFDSIVSWGYTVEAIKGEDFAAGYDVSPFDGIVISESVQSNNVNSFMEIEYPLPCFTMEGYSPRSDKWGWADKTDNVDWMTLRPATMDSRSMIIEDNTHYVTKEFEVGEEVAWSTEPDQLVLDGTNMTGFNLSPLIPDAIPLGSSMAVEFEGKPNLWAIDEGTMIPSTTGEVESKRIVVWGVNDLVLTPETGATPAFYNIVKRSIIWVLGDEPTSSAIQNINSSFSEVKLASNPVRGFGKISFNLEDQATVEVSAINLMGQKTSLSKRELFSAGSNEISFSTQDLNSGIYLYELKVNNSVYTGKMQIVK